MALFSTTTDEKRLNAILSSMAEGLIAIDQKREIILMNQVAGILLRFAPAEVIGQEIDKIFRPKPQLLR